MATQRLGIIMHGITGRMGYNQHLVRSICAIRDQGGVALAERRPRDARSDADRPQRREGRRRSRRSTASSATATDLDAALANKDDTIFFDAGSTQMRVGLLRKAIAAGKHIYCEKPMSETLAEAISVAQAAKDKGIKSGVVQDKLYLPGLRKIKMLNDAGFFGRILSVRGEFGYWVFEGDWGQPAQRPSWNYRKKEGGGIILDMLPPLALRARQPVRRGRGGVVPRRRPISPRASTKPARPTPRIPTTPPTRPSSSRAAPSPTSIRPGACA